MFTSDQHKVLSSEELLKAQQQNQQPTPLQKYLNLETKIQYLCFGVAASCYISILVEYFSR